MKQKIQTYRPITAIALLATTLAAPASATPIEGEFSLNAAALLFVLGVWALLMGLRNLRALRYRPMVPQRRKEETGGHSAEETD
jgi:hypothetical protein